eukprot:COSAG01_NODE_10367_length_2183_cov_3.327255_1_plen_273_part_00
MRCDGVGVGLVAALDAATASSVDDALDPELLRAWAGTSSASDATREQLGDRNELARYIVRGRDGVSIEKQAEVLRMELGEALEAWRAGRSAAAKKRVKQAASTARRWGTIQGYDGLVDAAAAAMREVDPRLMLKAQIRRSAGFKEVVQQFWDIMRVESTLTRVHMEGEGGGGASNRSEGNEKTKEAKEAKWVRGRGRLKRSLKVKITKRSLSRSLSLSWSRSWNRNRSWSRSRSRRDRSNHRPETSRCSKLLLAGRIVAWRGGTGPRQAHGW